MMVGVIPTNQGSADTHSNGMPDYLEAPGVMADGDRP